MFIFKFDIMNVFGNGTGINEHWIWEIIKMINEWEARSGHDVLVTRFSFKIREGTYFDDKMYYYNLTISDNEQN